MRSSPGCRSSACSCRCSPCRWRSRQRATTSSSGRSCASRTAAARRRLRRPSGRRRRQPRPARVERLRPGERAARARRVPGAQREADRHPPDEAARLAPDALAGEREPAVAPARRHQRGRRARDDGPGAPRFGQRRRPRRDRRPGRLAAVVIAQPRREHRDRGDREGDDGDARGHDRIVRARPRPHPARAPAALAAPRPNRSCGAAHALRGVDLTVGEGELVGLLGPNGAGKSTLVKIACGLVRPTGGTAEVCGAPAGTAAARRALGYLAELFRFPGWARADELLALRQRLAGSEGGADERAELLELVGLSEARDRRIETMSKGMQQRLGIAQALVGRPALLLLDEPTSALDPAGRRTVRGLLVELRRRGVAVLLNTHLLSEVERICDRVAIIDRGVLVAAGRPDDLSRPRGVEVETASGVRSFAAATREDVPEIVERLVRAGERVYEVRLVRSSLEDAYLAAVEAADPADDDGGASA